MKTNEKTKMEVVQNNITNGEPTTDQTTYNGKVSMIQKHRSAMRLAKARQYNELYKRSLEDLEKLYESLYQVIGEIEVDNPVVGMDAGERVEFYKLKVLLNETEAKVHSQRSHVESYDLHIQNIMPAFEEKSRIVNEQWDKTWADAKAMVEKYGKKAMGLSMILSGYEQGKNIYTDAELKQELKNDTFTSMVTQMKFLKNSQNR